MNEQRFIEVYQEALPDIWRFVRARMPSEKAAEDVTSEIFTSAWERRDRYDPERGKAVAWLYGIARRAIADWWRQTEREGNHQHAGEVDLERLLDSEQAARVDGVLVEKEALVALRGALVTLRDRERELLALRFAAGLKMHEIALVLGESEGAIKMALYRALRTLRHHFARQQQPVADESLPDVLAQAIDDIIAARRPHIPDPIYERMVVHLTVLHRPDVPEDLPERVAACVACEIEKPGQGAAPPAGGHGAAEEADESRRPAPVRMALAAGSTLGAALGWALVAPICLACSGALGVAVYTAVLGLAGVGHTVHLPGTSIALPVHMLSFLFVPLALVALLRSYRAHGVRWPSQLGKVALGVALLHVILHLAWMDSDLFMFLFQSTDILAGGLLTLAVAGNLIVALRQWRRNRAALAWRRAVLSG
ncbi:MAG: sigma-70 family RNA polymerase sigma factor [Candidatus Promineifilaceae bacterium]|nr:sigma-70 family RNA polymerase sigma factor [Candidatus Promineifilaceae bacterium]